MLELDPVSGARLASLASGRGGAPTLEEWPWVLGLLVILALVGTRVLVAVGLTKVEALLVAALAPLLVFVDAPLGRLSETVSLAANLAGCLIPSAVALKVLLERRVPWGEGLILVAAGIVVSYMSSHVVADRGVLLQYRIPAALLGLLAAGLLFRRADASGPGAFAGGALGVVIGADVMRLSQLAEGSGRVVLGGAGLLDGILLVAVLAAAIAEGCAMGLRALVRVRAPARPTA